MRLYFSILAIILCCHGYAQEKQAPFDSLPEPAAVILDEERKKVEGVRIRIDSISQNIQAKLDSACLQGSDTVLMKRLTLMKSKIDSLKNAASVKPGESGQAVRLQVGLDDVVGKTLDPVNRNLAILQQNGIQDVSSLPSTKLLDVSRASSPIGDLLEKAELSEAGISLSDAALPEINSSFGSVDVAERFSDLNGAINNYTPNTPDFRVANLGQIEGIPSKIEDQILSLDQIDEIQAELAHADKLKRYYDPLVAREEALNKAKEEAVNHFAGHEEELKAAMEKLSTLKRKFPHPEGSLDALSRRQRFLKDKRFVQRLVPGLSLQPQKSKTFWLDINPHIGYKISPRFVSGLGWNERFCYDFDEWSWDVKNHIYGLRSFVHFRLRENIWLKVDAETMNTPVRATPLLTSEIVGRDWVWSFFGGMKRDFQVSKTINGNVQMLYNLYDPEKRSPYTNRFEVRIGIEVPLGKGSSRKRSE